MGVIIKLFSTPTIQCEKYTRDSTTMDHHDWDEANRKTIKMHDVIRDICIDVLDETDFDELMKSELSKIGDKGNQCKFLGHLIMDVVLKKLDAKKLDSICSYLSEVNKEENIGRIGLCYLFSCYKDSTPSRSTSVIYNGDVSLHPFKIGGLGVDVKLPMNSGKVDNPLYSERMVTYLCGFWMSRPALWSRAIIAVLEDAFDRKFFANSQGVEGVINQEKNHRSTFKEDMSSLSALMLRHWEDSFNGSRLAMNQIRTFRSVIEQKKNRADRKGKKGIDENSDMKWKKVRRVSEVVRELDVYRNRMDSALVMSSRSGGVSYRENSLTAKWRVLSQHATSMGDASFMGKNVFIEWMKNERKIALQSDWKAVIDSFCVRYGCDGADSEQL
jgi:hypothetical protein